ncbi:MAG: hypothetical protein DRR00_20450, partial [Candidatus Parabeggiatoa sp. nov. 3]
NGESFQTLFNRCQDFWNDILTKPYQTIIIVTHLGVIRALLAYILEIGKNHCASKTIMAQSINSNTTLMRIRLG